MRKRVDVSVQAYSASRVNQELAKEGIPLPFGNRLWATNWPTQNAPFPGLVVHLISTVSNYVLVFQSYLTLHRGYCHNRTPTVSRISLYLGRCRLSSADHQSFRHSRACVPPA
jgi:hypothetical protein